MLRNQLDEVVANPEEVTTAVAAVLCRLFRRVLTLAHRHDVERAVRQRPFAASAPPRTGRHPRVELRRRCQDGRHRLRVDRRDDGVGLTGQERIKQVIAFDLVGLGAARALPRAPDPSEEKQRTIVRQREPAGGGTTGEGSGVSGTRPNFNASSFHRELPIAIPFQLGELSA